MMFNENNGRFLGENKFFEYEGITFEIIRRKVRYFRVEFNGEIPRMILPPGGDQKKVLKENIGRIKRKYEKYLDLIDVAGELKFYKRDSQAFEEIVRRYTELFSKELQVNVREIKYRKMRRMWGNCRSNGVITLNSRLKKLPENVISYIIFHELLHLDERGGHSIRFNRRMKKRFSDHKKIEMELKSYFIKFDLEDVKLKNGL